MDKQEFKKFCHTEFIKRGFQKKKSMYYLQGDQGVLCGIWLQKSNFGACYYVNYYFFLGEYGDPKLYPIRYDFDLHGRIKAMTKVTTYNGKFFMTDGIEYEHYSTDELRPYFDKEFEEIILPPVLQNKKSLLDNLEQLSFPPLKEEYEILVKLQAY